MRRTVPEIKASVPRRVLVSWLVPSDGREHQKHPAPDLPLDRELRPAPHSCQAAGRPSVRRMRGSAAAHPRRCSPGAARHRSLPLRATPPAPAEYGAFHVDFVMGIVE